MLWKRVVDYSQIRHVQKVPPSLLAPSLALIFYSQALFLIEYLLRYGADRFVLDAKNRSDDIGKLKSYRYIEENRDIAGDGLIFE